MAPHRRLSDWLRANPRKVDFVAAGALILLLGIAPAVSLALSGPADLLVSFGLLLPLPWRRSRPVPAAAVAVVFCLLYWALGGEPLPAFAAVPIYIYALAAYAPAWASRGGLAVGLLGALMSTRLNSYGSLPDHALMAVSTGLLVLVSWTFGDLARARRMTVQALQDRAHRLEVERQQERGLAAADERAHIAREMHDIVAHSLSVIITQADGARYASEQDPAIARATLGTIAETGRSSLQEMRRLLGVLRGGGEASTRPLPGLADIEVLVDTIRRSGLPLEYSATGSARRQLAAGAGLTAYRIIQEALTNVLKHAGPRAAATVRLDWTAKGLDLRIQDDGRGAAVAPSPGGQGIQGMTERVGLYDGTVAAAPLTGGGFQVQAFIPYTEA